MTQPRHHNAIEMYYTPNQAALLLGLDRKTVIDKMKAREFGEECYDLAKTCPEDEPKTHDYRIPASGINAYLNKRRLFTEIEPGIAARTEGELRRKG